MSRVINPVGRNWKTEEKADYSTLLSGCRCLGAPYATGKAKPGCACDAGNSQANLHCDAGL